MQKEKMISLFDYQGRPDKEKIGRKVYEYAKFRKVKTGIRQFSNKKLPNRVITYPISLLSEYFTLKAARKVTDKFF